jgi:hypothetical protein
MKTPKHGSLLDRLTFCTWLGMLVGCTYDYDRFHMAPRADGSGGEPALGGMTSTEQETAAGGVSSVGGTSSIENTATGGNDSQGGTSALRTAAMGGSKSQGGASATGSSEGGQASGGTSQFANSSGIDAGQGGSTNQNMTTSGGSATGGQSTTTNTTVAGCRYASDCGSSSEAQCENQLCVCSGTVCQPGQTCRRHGSNQECG